MAKERTDKSRYKHRTTGEYCTCAQLVAEIMCLNKAASEGHGMLGYKFWSQKSWRFTFQKQVMLANKVLHGCPEEVLMATINDPSMKTTFSLNNPRFKTVLQRKLREYKAEQSKVKEKKVEEVIENPTFGSRKKKKKSTLQRLKEIDGKEKEGGK